MHALLACRKDRPTALFKNGVCKEVADGETGGWYGEIDGTPFVASTSCNDKKHTNILGTCYGAVTTSTHTVQTLTQDDVDDDQCVLNMKSHVRTACHAKYQEMMGCVDQVDREVLDILPKFKCTHWTEAYLLWIVMVVIQVNASRLYMSAAETIVSTTEWSEMAYKALAKLDQPFKVAHTIERGSRYVYCKPCYAMLSKKRTRTKYVCDRCGGVCEECHNLRHEDYTQLESMPRSTHSPLK